MGKRSIGEKIVRRVSVPADQKRQALRLNPPLCSPLKLRGGEGELLLSTLGDLVIQRLENYLGVWNLDLGI